MPTQPLTPFLVPQSIPSPQSIASTLRDVILPLLPILEATAHTQPLQELQLILSSLEQPMHLAVVGRFSAGKSTLLNALIGESIAPTDIRTTTATLHLFQFGPERQARIQWHNGSEQSIPLHELHQLTAFQDEGQRAKHIHSITISLPLEQLRNLCIVDTPGLDAATPEHAEITHSFLRRADAILYLFTVRELGHHSDAQFFASFANEHPQKTIAVINKIDEIDYDSETIEDIIQAYLRPHLGKYLSAIAYLSAKDALFAQQQQQPALLQKSRFPLLLQTLQQHFFSFRQLLQLLRASQRLRLSLQSLSLDTQSQFQLAQQQLQHFSTLQSLQSQQHSAFLQLLQTLPTDLRAAFLAWKQQTETTTQQALQDASFFYARNYQLLQRIQDALQDADARLQRTQPLLLALERYLDALQSIQLTHELSPDERTQALAILGHPPFDEIALRLCLPPDTPLPQLLDTLSQIWQFWHTESVRTRSAQRKRIAQRIASELIAWRQHLRVLSSTHPSKTEMD